MLRRDAVGYIAVSRSIFDHPLLKDRPDWHVAWEKLIAAAAWKPRGQAGRFGVVHLERGQLAGTVRDLAALLGWRRSTLSYFIGRLLAEKMIRCEVVRTKISTRNGAKTSQRITILTICNYSEYQRTKNPAAKTVGQGVGQKVGQEMPLLPGIIEEVATETDNHSKAKSLGAQEIRLLTKPKDGQRSKDRKWVWHDYHSSGWEQYAADWQEVHQGAILMPEQRLGGWGKWFFALGARLEPPKKNKRRKAA